MGNLPIRKCEARTATGKQCRGFPRKGSQFCSIHAPELNAEHIYIREAAELLNRRLGTVRKWDRNGILPEHLRPMRGPRGWRYWTPGQIEMIKEWMRETEFHAGRGLPHWNPTEKELDKAINAMRRVHNYKKPRLEEIEFKP